MSRGFGCVCEVDRGVVGDLEVRGRVRGIKVGVRVFKCRSGDVTSRTKIKKAWVDHSKPT